MNIIVTGASRGIGYEAVKKLASGNHTIIAVSRNAEKLNALKMECEQIHPASKVISIACDLRNEQELSILVTKITSVATAIDLLINNAGAIVNKPFAEITPADLQHVYTVNLFAPFRLIQALLPLMNTVSRGHILNISSMGGFQGTMKFAGLSAYSSSKAALICLTECLAEEFKNRNIAFNCLALGAAQTEMLEEAFPGYKAPISASEMADFVVNFALIGHKYLNGKVLPVSLSTP